ncbi:MAG TPA: DoxX family membrane protein [Pyrinomonadaceae bacterium]|nr:DoxX family membrane protein [Pyrinomonadaceae bacterium]
MNIAMKIVRTLTGLLFIFSSAVYFLKLIEPPELSGPIKQFNEGLVAAGYFLPLLKTVELVCGIALVSGFFVPLALVILSPVVVHIFFVHTFLDRSGLPIAIYLVLAFIFLGYSYRERFAPILKP